MEIRVVDFVDRRRAGQASGRQAHFARPQLYWAIMWQYVERAGLLSKRFVVLLPKDRKVI